MKVFAIYRGMGLAFISVGLVIGGLAHAQTASTSTSTTPAASANPFDLASEKLPTNLFNPSRDSANIQRFLNQCTVANQIADAAKFSLVNKTATVDPVMAECPGE